MVSRILATASKGMASPEKGEISYRIQFKKIGAGHLEKIPIIRSVYHTDCSSERQSKI